MSHVCPRGSKARSLQKAHDGPKDSERQVGEDKESAAECPDSCSDSGNTGHCNIFQ